MRSQRPDATEVAQLPENETSKPKPAPEPADFSECPSQREVLAEVPGSRGALSPPLPRPKR